MHRPELLPRRLLVELGELARRRALLPVGGARRDELGCEWGRGVREVRGEEERGEERSGEERRVERRCEEALPGSMAMKPRVLT